MKKYVHLFSCLLLVLARLAGCGITSAGKDRGASETSSSGSGSKVQLLPTTRTAFVSDL
ncbi:hypothetical protein H8K20_03695 [Neobittarella massiliensis]|uniref:Uncharacterized protein n=1 Tax=Neobittarella massiliensis (ex Bilen et al. 2018) TaxID=2041842 RepID=A0A8J6IJ82_9FIRM|nr:hypothetical protein [Neobittarella massiliensis]MBC3515501.1 hypothetical protein [Neobittarella massiliensis]